VRGVDLLSFDSDPRLVTISVAAMRQWRFQPCLLRSQAVACDVLATLRFRNPPGDGVVAQR
jgi:hypothetical protein